MSIKTLLFAGIATFGLCASAQAQTTVVGQLNGLNQAANATSTINATQSLTQGKALVNTGVQVQANTPVSLSLNLGVQNNIATVVSSQPRIYLPKVGK